MLDLVSVAWLCIWTGLFRSHGVFPLRAGGSRGYGYRAQLISEDVSQSKGKDSRLALWSLM
jgi:hypothetical protein